MNDNYPKEDVRNLPGVRAVSKAIERAIAYTVLDLSSIVRILLTFGTLCCSARSQVPVQLVFLQMHGTDLKI